MNFIIELKKKSDENEKQYIWRLCLAKTTGTLDMTWEALTDILNKELRNDGTALTKDSYRKPFETANAWYSDVFSTMLDGDYAKEIEIKKRELEKERHKLNATKVEYSRDLRKQSRFELFYENVRNAITTLPLPDFKPVLSRECDIEYVLTIADIHAGANFVSENNSYSFDICKERFEVLLAETIEFVKYKDVKTLKIIELGDTIQGLLRLSDLKLNESSVVEATIYISRIISHFLNELSTYCYVEYYHVPSSNHSQNRPLSSKAGELASEDVEYVIANYIKDVLSPNDRVSVNLNFGKQYIDINIHDFNVIAMHGHQIKDIKNSLKNLSHLHRKFYDFVFLAHFHGGSEIIEGESTLNDTEVLVCPSFIGSDPYSDSIMRGSKASCKIFGFDYLYGHTETYKIILN